MTERTPLNSTSDAALMAGLAHGDVEMLGLLYSRYGESVRDLLYRLHRDVTREEADDLCQEVFLEALRSAKRYEHRDRLRSWLYGIAVRKAHGWRRKRWLRRNLLNRWQDPTPTVDVAPAEARLAARADIEQGLAALNQGQREVLILHAVEGLSASEIAETLGIRENTVWTRLHRARQTMRRCLKEAEPPNPGSN